MAVFKSGGISIPIYPNKASDYQVGESIFIDVAEVETEFLVVHKGVPNSSYYQNIGENDIWLLMKDQYVEQAMNNTTASNFAESTTNTYLNTDFLQALSAEAQNIILSVDIPFYVGYNNAGTKINQVMTASTKIFVPSAVELGIVESDSASYLPYETATMIDGASLDYFTNYADLGFSSLNNARISNHNSAANVYWTRTSRYSTTASYAKQYIIIATSGKVSNGTATTTSYGVRPMFIIPGNAAIDPTTHKPWGVLV